MDENDNGKFRLERVKHQNLQIFGLKLNKYMSNIYPLEVVGRGSETQIHVGKNVYKLT